MSAEIAVLIVVLVVLGFLFWKRRPRRDPPLPPPAPAPAARADPAPSLEKHLGAMVGHLARIEQHVASRPTVVNMAAPPATPPAPLENVFTALDAAIREQHEHEQNHKDQFGKRLETSPDVRRLAIVKRLKDKLS